MYPRYFKRILDLVLLFIIFIPALMLLAVLSFTILIMLGRPIFFKQERPGLNEKIFTMYKLRSMSNETDSEGVLLPNHQRTSKFGRFLRASSLDELPELYNVFKNEMSFVGPRPLKVEYLALYNKKHKRRHEVKPGLTGLAQVEGRNMLSWSKRFDLDVEYINHNTFLADILILTKTIWVVASRKGLDSTGSNLTAFTGYE